MEAAEAVIEPTRTPTYEYLILKGNQVESMARLLLKYEEKDRCYWFAAGYVQTFDITLVQYDLSRTLHKLRIEEIVHEQEYEILDWEKMESVNSDDVHILETDVGLI